MAISEQSRHELYRRLEETLGVDAATTLMEHLPPVGWSEVATKRDLDAFSVATKRDLDAFSVATKRDLEALSVAFKRDLEALDVATKRDLEALDVATKRDLEALDVATKRDMETLEHRLRADVRAEINSAFTSQTRTIMFSVIGSNVTIAALAFAAASFR